MQVLHHISIRHKITVLVMVITTVSLLVASAVFISSDRVNTRESATELLQAIADVVAANVRVALLSADKPGALETLGFLKHHEHIQAAAIYTTDGGEFAVYRRTPAQAPLPPPGRQPGELLHSGESIELFTAIYHQDEITGHVYLRSNMGIIKEHLGWYASIAGLVLLASLLIAFLLSAQLQRIITNPLLHLSATARRITTEKNYSLRADGKARDETGNLIVDFNKMLDQIQDRDNELEIHQSELEARVARRTSELEIANRELAIAMEKTASVAKRMEYHAHHDALTGLPNRVLLNDRIDTALSHARREQSMLALLFLDLDRFKIINDSLGHAVGDQLLRVIARRLKNCVRDEDTVARLGGDEFMVLLPSISGSSDAGRIGRKISEALVKQASCNGHELHITTSIGISIYPFDGTDPETLVRNADISMYRAKELGRNKLVYYTAEMDAASRKQLALETNLRKALERDEFRLVYQPKIDISNNSIVGVEALLRWEHATMGVVSPLDFVPVAEDSGLIVPIGEWVIRRAFRQLRDWHDAGHEHLSIAVNLSSAQLSRPGLVEVVRESLDEYRLDTSKVELEITEHVVMRNMDSAIATLESLKIMGISIAMDDFGTGFSSLSYLRRLPIDTVKIDQAFVRDIPDNREDASIAQAIIAMARSLGLSLIAEGVENIKQLNFFRQQGVHLVQGYLFSKAVPAEEFSVMLDARTALGPVNLVRQR